MVESNRDQLDEQGRNALLRRGPSLQCGQEDQECGQTGMPGEGGGGEDRLPPRGHQHPPHHPHHPHRLPPRRRPLDQPDLGEGQDATAVEELAEPHAVHHNRKARGGTARGVGLGVGFQYSYFLTKLFHATLKLAGARFLETQIQVDSLSGTMSLASP